MGVGRRVLLLVAPDLLAGRGLEDSDVDQNSVRTVFRVTMAALARIAKRTQTPADDLMAAILRANEDRIVEAVLTLVSAGGDAPTETQISEALEGVGIRV